MNSPGKTNFKNDQIILLLSKFFWLHAAVLQQKQVFKKLTSHEFFIRASFFKPILFFCFFFNFQRIYTIHQLFAILLSFFWSLSEFSYASLVKKNASLVSRLPEERWRRIGNKHKSCNLDVDANSPLGAIYGSVLCITKCLSVYMYY